MEKAAKRKMFLLVLIASAVFTCVPHVASSNALEISKPRAEFKTESVQNRVSESLFYSVKRDRNYDRFEGIASESSVAPKRTLQESASDLAGQLGRNRVSGRTAGGKRVDIDLRGKGHFDKATGKKIETPHVHEADINIGPNGKTNLGNKTTRPATPQDIRNARKLGGVR